jgi:hypothetical protein
MMQVPNDDREYPVAHGSKAFQAYAKTSPAKVHGIYEEGMLEIDPAAALAEVDALLTKSPAGGTAAITSGHAAACEVVGLMDRARKRLAPEAILKADDPSLGPKARARQLWDNPKIRQATVASLADSVQVLARIWQSAWTLGGAGGLADDDLEAQTEEALQDIYRSDTFLLPMTLAEMAASGKFGPPLDTEAVPRASGMMRSRPPLRDTPRASRNRTPRASRRR